MGKWRCIGTDEVPDPQCSCAELLSHLPERVLRNGPSTHKVSPFLSFLLFRSEQSLLTHHTERAFRTACIAPLPQTAPELDHARRWISAVHVTDELQLGFCVRVRMAVRTFGLTGKGCRTSIPVLYPEADVVLPAGAVFFRVFHEGLPIGHVLCYTFAHEEYGLLLPSCSVVA